MSTKYIYLGATFVMGLVVANFIAVKLVSIGPLVFPASVLAYSITFLMTDTIGEVWGKRSANIIVLSGFFASIIMIGLVYLSIMVPSASIWKNQDAYELIIGLSPRITIASMLAYLISQFNDVWLFHLIREKTAGRKLWIRNNVSTAGSQLLDQFFFVIFAFGGIVDLKNLFIIIASGYIVKITIAALDTPFVYLLVRWARK